MGSEPPSKRESSGRSFWTTAPGILTGIAALITAVGGLIAALHTAGLIGARSPDRAAAPPTAAAPAVTPEAGQPVGQRPAGPAPPPAGGATTGGCFAGYFQGIAGDRVATLEAGTRDFDVIGPQQPKGPPVGLTLTENGRPIGGMRFAFYETNSLFKVETVVDAQCRSIEAFSNVSRGGDRRVMQNWDSLQIRLGTGTYELRLGYGAGEIGASFVRTSP